MSTSPGKDGSLLCLACGICCQGVLHREASVRKDEVAAVRRLGLSVVGAGEDLSFPLPCSLHRNGRCTVYAERPSACQAYECKVLKRYREGSASWEESVQSINVAKDLAERVRRGIGMTDPEQSVWTEMRSLETSRLASLVEQREALLDVVSLLTLCRSRFQNRSAPVEVLGP
jgi:Fe-S-cluster containining protein